MKLTPDDIQRLSVEQKRKLVEELLKKKRELASKTGPASYGQQALWTIDQVADKNIKQPIYVIPCAARILSAIDIQLFQQAFDQLGKRHASLRTVFKCVDGIPQQVIQSKSSIKIDRHDVNNYSDTQIQDRLNELYQQPFDLERGPLMRVNLLSEGHDQHILLITQHHIISDGWSIWTLLEELGEIYAALAEGRAHALKPLEIQHSDFVKAQNEYIKSSDGEASRAYWMEHLSGNLSALNMPTDFPRPPVKTYSGETHTFEISTDLMHKIKAAAKQERVTLFTYLMAAYQTLLYRYTQQEDICVGFPTAGRNDSQYSGIVGYFANIVVSRAQCSADTIFKDLLQSTRQSVMQGVAHQDYPFARLIEELQLERDASRSPLVQTLFTLQRPHKFHAVADLMTGERSDAAVKWGPLEVEAYPFHEKESRFDFNLEMVETSDSLFGFMRYSTDLFDPKTIARWCGHFQKLLEELVENAYRPIIDYPLLSIEELKVQLVDWNRTQQLYAPHQCLHQLFEDQVADHPQRVAIEFEGQSLTYAELNDRANQMAAHLIDMGVEPDQMVGVLVERSFDLIVSLLAVLKSGGAYVPLDPLYPKERIEFILEDAKAPVLITQEAFVNNLPPMNAEIVCVDKFVPDSIPAQNVSSWAKSNNLAYVIFTSGSTGKPKGVQIEHQAVVNFLHAMRREPGLSIDDTILAVTTISFDIAVLEIFLPLTTGARIRLASREAASDGRQLIDLLNGVSLLQATPATWRLLLDSGWVGNENLTMLCGGEALPRTLSKQLVDKGKVLWNMYGPTETTIWSSVYQVTADQISQADAQGDGGCELIGRPIDNTQFYVYDKKFCPLPMGVAGELLIGGDGLARGYHNREELTCEKFIEKNGERLYRTGDLVRYRLNGELEYLGRLDHQVKIRGYRIELGEIEAAIGTHPNVAIAAVITYDVGSEKRLAAYYVNGESAVSNQELRTYLKEHLPQYMVPSICIELEEMPLTPNGKIDRKSLPHPDTVSVELDTDFIEAENKTQQQLVDIWMKILGVERVGIKDNFFDLGGHSLLATQLIARIRRELNKEISLRQIFEAPTIVQLEKVLMDESKSNQVDESLTIKTVPRTGSLPLSFAQQRLWFLDQLEGLSATYNLAFAVKIDGIIEENLVKQSFNLIVQRHEVLRTNYSSKEGRAHQTIRLIEELPMPIVDLTEVSLEEQEQHAQERIDHETQTPFSLSEDWLIRMSLLRLSDQKHILLLTMHHIVSDGWSMGVFLQEFKNIYMALKNKQPQPLSELRVQYIDFAHWQRNWLKGDVLERQLSFWKDELSGAPALLEMPTDRPRPAVEDFSGDYVSFHIDTKEYAELMALAKANGVTLFMVLHAAFAMLLSRYSGKEDIVIGAPVANRHNRDVEQMIGFFVNSLVLRTDLSNNPTFEELLKRVKKADLNAFDYPHVPFEQLIERLGVKRSLSHAPWFQIFFALQNAPLEDMQTEDFTMDLLEQRNQTSMFDITVDMQERADGINGVLQFKTDLYDRSTAQRLVDYYLGFLKQVVAQPDRPIAKYQMLTALEEKLILTDFNQTQKDYSVDQCVHHLIEQQALTNPDQLAVRQGEQRLTYRELNQRANQVAHYLIEQGAEPDKLIGLSMTRSVDMIVALLGILKSGSAYVPIDPDYPQERKDFMQSDADLQTILTAEQIEHIDTKSYSKDNPQVDMHAKNLAYIIYTSGTTGKPKGVMIQHDSLVNYVQDAIVHLGMTSEDRLLQFSSISFDAAAEEIFGTLVSGATLVLRTEEMIRSAKVFTEASQEYGITIWDMPTAYWHQLSREILEKGIDIPKSVRVVLFGGEKVSADLLKQWLKKYPDRPTILNTYGPTESTIVSTIYQANNNTDAIEQYVEVPIGRPVANLKAYVLDQHLNPVPVGVPGELFVSGLGLARGYLKRPELTAEKFLDNPFEDGVYSRMYRTGDLVKFLPNGNIDYLGRVDKQVKIRGYRIELQEIEAVLNKFEGVQDVFLKIIEPSQGVKSIVAYIIAMETNDDFLSRLRAYLKDCMPSYMLPAFIIPMTTFPITVNGKVDAAALPSPEDLSEQSREDYESPRDEQEQTLSELWSEVLGIKNIGIHDNFFEMGGHSLLAAQLVTRVYETFNVDLPLRNLFEQPTIAGLMASIRTPVNDSASASSFDVQPVNRQQDLPLSFAQQRLWFLDQLEGPNATYNMPVAIRIKGEMDIDLFDRVFQEVIRRHEVFRTRFNDKRGKPNLVIDSTSDFKLLRRDFSTDDLTVQQQKVQEAVINDARQPFDLQNQHLVRAEVITLNEQEHVLLFTMHHIISDGWSTEILIQEFAQLYDAFYNNRPSPLPELAVQYADFAYHQNNWLQGEMLDAQLNYWKSKLQDAPPLLDMPTDRVRPAVESYNGQHITFEIDRGITDGLNALARDNNATLFMVIHSVLAILLNRYSRQDDIVLGSPIANRPSKNVEPLIGFFVNTLVLRSDLGGDPTFVELLNRIRKSDLNDFEHPHVPFEHLVDALKPERNLSHSPWFQVMFVLQNTPMEKDAQIANLVLDPIDQDTSTAKFELTFGFLETENGLTGSLEYNCDLYDRATVESMARYLSQLMHSIIQQPKRPISEYTLIKVDDCKELLAPSSIEEVGMKANATIIDLFTDQVKNYADKHAIEFGNQSITYQELDQRSNQLANYLINQGLQSEDLVGLYFERSIEMLVGLWGILKAGVAYVPIDPSYPRDRADYILNDTKMPRILAHGQTVQSLSMQSDRVIDLDAEWNKIADYPTTAPDVDIDPHHLAYVIYTSGTTGKPKGVLIEHQSLLNFVGATIRDYDFSSNDRVLQFASLSFDAAAEEIYPCLLSGGTLIVRDDQMISSVEEFLSSCHQLQLTVLDLPTAYWHRLMAVMNEASEQIPEQLRLLIIGGERARPECVQDWHALKGHKPLLVNTYGPTEATVVATACKLDQSNSADVLAEVPIGLAIANTQSYILDEHLNPVPPGIPGELYLGGRGLARGYLNQPELTAEKFIRNPFIKEGQARLYRTGDLVRCRPDGLIEFRGRVDRQVKIRGYRIELAEIETILSQHDSVRTAVVSAMDDSQHNQMLVAHVCSSVSAIDVKELREYMKSNVPAYMIPAYFVTVDNIPLNTNGKVDYKRLPQPNVDTDVAKVEYVAPRTEIEKKLADIWKQLLRIERIGVHDDFFDLGGHSLIATQMIARIREEFDRELSLRHLFESSTIAQVAEKLTGMDDVVSSVKKLPPIKVLPRRKYLPVDAGQKALWDAYQKDKKAFTYNICGAIQLKIGLDADILKHSVNAVIQRHENLRVTFHRRGETVVQQIHGKVEIDVPVMDLSALNSADQHIEVAKLAQEHAQHAFNLCKGPLIRVDLLVLNSRETVILLNIHHIVADGWSMDVLVNEIMSNYQTIGRGVKPMSDDLPIHYYDYSEWVKELTEGEIGQNEINYWKNKFEGMTELLNLPLDYPRPEQQGREGEVIMLPLGAKLTERIKRFCQDSSTRVTVFSLMQTVFAMLLRHYCGQNDIPVGTTVAARHTPDLEKLIGLLVQTVVIRNEIDPNQTFNEFLSRSTLNIAEAFDHSFIPFGDIKEKLGIEKRDDYTVVYQVKFLLQSFAGASSHETGLDFKMLQQDIKKAKGDLFFIFNEDETGLVGEITYRKELFKHETIERMCEEYRALLEAVVTDPHRKIDEYHQASIVSMNSSTDGKPFFCIHPIGGNVFCYAPLARAMGHDTKFYALQSPALSGRQCPTSITEMAQMYIEDMRKVQPNGPYRLGGWSMGGVVAYEMAQQLQSSGQTVENLTLIDSYTPEKMKLNTATDLDLLSVFAKDLSGITKKKYELPIGELKALPVHQRFDAFLNHGQQHDLFPANVDRTYMQRVFEIFTTNHHALRDYQLQPYTGDAVLFYANNNTMQLIRNNHGWKKWIKGTLQAQPIPGNHYTMVQLPQVKELAEHMQTHLHAAKKNTTKGVLS